MRLVLLFSIALFGSGILIGCGGAGGGTSNGDTPPQGNENGEADWGTASWDEFSWQ